MKVSAFARHLDHPRWLYVLPNGDVLVAETNAPTRPDLVARALTPDYALGAHTASLGLAWSGTNSLPACRWWCSADS